MRAIVATFALAAGLVLHGPFLGWSSSCCGSLVAASGLYDCCGERGGGTDAASCAASDAPCVDAHACNTHAAGVNRKAAGVSASGIAAAPLARRAHHQLLPARYAGVGKRGRARQPPPPIASSLEYVVLLN